MVQPYDHFVVAWLALAVLSALYVAVDQFRNNPESWVMQWGFILITLYSEPRPGTWTNRGVCLP